jgi:hypothetical protein
MTGVIGQGKRRVVYLLYAFSTDLLVLLLFASFSCKVFESETVLDLILGLGATIYGLQTITLTSFNWYMKDRLNRITEEIPARFPDDPASPQLELLISRNR